jgi:endonuclease YncB( thermonuclease family)
VGPRLRPSTHSVARIGLSLAFWAFLAGVAAAEEFAGRVVGITDGDTIKVLHAGRAETVRLQGVDAPEKRQAYGERARRFVADLAFDQTVIVRATGRDRSGRLLGEVVLPDGRSLNQELVRAGYAWWFRRYSRDLQLARLEAQARRGRRGLWADPEPAPPWEYRSTGGGKTPPRALPAGLPNEDG